MTNIAINGFGRIGRNVLKAGINKKGFNIVAINDLTDTKTLAYLLKYDTAYGLDSVDIKHTKNSLIINGKKIPVFAQKDPEQLPWKDYKVDVVLECTGFFRTREGSEKHLKAGAKGVIISAPAKSDDIPTHVMGVNHDKIKKSSKIINNASCTTNCIVPVMAVLKEKLGIKKAMFSTVHGYTAAQAIQDAPRKDLRRGRAAAQNVVPTTTGAAIATSKVIKGIDNKFDGVAIRVPVIVGSLIDVTAILKKKTTVEKINDIFVKASKLSKWKGILATTKDPIVSSDIIGNSYSSTVDLEMTRVVDGDLVKIFAWYDNEWGYSNRLSELALVFAKNL